jgi:GT2 family glycosyltransferase
MELAVLRSLGPIDASPQIRPISIVIPTYNHLEDLLRPCLESIREYTDFDKCEVVVVANGCTDRTVEYLESLPAPFRHVVHPEPLGFTKATNAGIREARGEYIVLLNNDTVILPQPRNMWIDILLAPFKGNHIVGMSGPVKFGFDCGGTRRRALAFWCAMVKRELFSKLGLLDEAFSPGMGEDADFSIKAELAGYALVQVPKDGQEEFGKGIPQQIFPIYHKGSGTFGDKDYSEISRRNSALLATRYGIKGDRLEEIYAICWSHPSDTNALFPTFRKYAAECPHITEFGVRGVFSTWAFLAARPKRMIGYDVQSSSNIEEARIEAGKAGVEFLFVQADVLEATLEPTDLLFIDTRHTHAQLKGELERHAEKVRRYILVHDTESFGRVGEDGGPGELQAIEEFLASHPEWGVRERLTVSNGLVVLERGGAASPGLPAVRQVAVSIVIPTVAHFQDALKPCLEAVLAYTDLADKEIVVVANGSPREAVDHVKALSTMEAAWNRKGEPSPIRILEFNEPIGYIRAVNAGIAASSGTHVVTLDDDSFLMAQPVDQWLRLLMAPFLRDREMGATGPFSTVYEELGQVLHSGCTMYLRSALLALGLFDEAFNPGYMGDEDLAIRLRKAGWHLAEVPEGQKREYVDGFFHIQFPVVHTGTVNTMPKHTTDLPLVARNRKLLLERHGPKKTSLEATGLPSVSIVIPTYNHLEDLLKPCLSTLAQYTDLDGIEVIVVANGCTDGTEEHVRSLGAPFRVISFPDPLGYTRATNEGIKVARGEFLVFLNNDCQLLPQPKSQWLEWMLEPFRENPKMGVTGPLQLHDDYADADVIIGFCLTVKRSVLAQAMAETGGLLDEVFSPGGGEDIDLCCKARRAGYLVRQVPQEGKLGFSHTNTGEFMIWHKNNQTFKDIPEYTRWIIKRNGFVNLKRYNKHIKLNLGAGGIEHKDYLSVDLHDNRASIIMDATKLDFEENSVAEILAVHLFEHLSPYKALDVLKGWLRILRPGGKLVMEMPDVEQLCKRFVTADTGQRYGILNAVYGSVNTTGEGEPSEITSPHLFGWWPQSIADHLLNAGFVDVKFGPERYPHPESNMHVEATKPLAATMMNCWTHPKVQVPFGEETSYRKAMEFLAGCATVEDWGCGTAYAKRFLSSGTYVGIDGSPSPFCDKVEDLQVYRSEADGILLRHVLEHNRNWRAVLENALSSFRKRLVLVLFTPFGSETRELAWNQKEGVPDISFKKEDLTGLFGTLPYTEEALATDTQYRKEHVFYIRRP